MNKYCLVLIWVVSCMMLLASCKAEPVYESVGISSKQDTLVTIDRFQMKPSSIVTVNVKDNGIIQWGSEGRVFVGSAVQDDGSEVCYAFVFSLASDSMTEKPDGSTDFTFKSSRNGRVMLMSSRSATNIQTALDKLSAQISEGWNI